MVQRTISCWVVGRSVSRQVLCLGHPGGVGHPGGGHLARRGRFPDGPHTLSTGAPERKTEKGRRRLHKSRVSIPWNATSHFLASCTRRAFSSSPSSSAFRTCLFDTLKGLRKHYFESTGNLPRTVALLLEASVSVSKSASAQPCTTSSQLTEAPYQRVGVQYNDPYSPSPHPLSFQMSR